MTVIEYIWVSPNLPVWIRVEWDDICNFCTRKRGNISSIQPRTIMILLCGGEVRYPAHKLTASQEKLRSMSTENTLLGGHHYDMPNMIVVDGVATFEVKYIYQAEQAFICRQDRATFPAGFVSRRSYQVSALKCQPSFSKASPATKLMSTMYLLAGHGLPAADIICIIVIRFIHKPMLYIV